jgi:hypothetical protein
VKITVKLTNADNIQIGLRKFGAAIPGITSRIIGVAMRRVRESYRGPYSGYSVPERVGQNYTRTGNLNASTYVEQRGMSYTLVSNAYHDGRPYSVYPLGDGLGLNQAWMHVGRWPTVRSKITEAMEPMVKEIAKAFEEEAKKDLSKNGK